MTKDIIYYATGRRKSAIARTWIQPGTGENLRKRKVHNDYFGTDTARTYLPSPWT